MPEESIRRKKRFKFPIFENIKHFGAILTGIAAIITASIPIFSYLKEDKKENIQNEIKIQKNFAYIDDPDGWVNLRVEPNSNSRVITKIENGYRVEILEKNGNWYKVKTYINDVGYIYSDRLKLKK